MFEGIVANLLNKHLGKYIQNLDTENLKIGIIDGRVELTDLQLKPEALFELDLPVEVKAGYVGKISLAIPWTSLYSMPVKVTVEDVYVLAGPIPDRKYDARKERALALAIKRNKLLQLENTKVDEDDPAPEDQSFIEKLTATIVNNIQVSVSRIHIRYEDKVTSPDHPFACGIMLKSLSAETTNGQWQPTQIDAQATQINKLVHLQALSVYWNPYIPEQSLVRGKLHTTAWRNLLKNSLDTHRVMEEDFDFIMRPVSARAKLMLNKDETTTLPKQMANLIMEDIDVLISRQQFLNMLSLTDSFKMMAVNQRYMKYNPEVKVKGHVKAWWKYAYTAVVEETIRPYSWQRIKAHRERYRQYKNTYKKKLLYPDNENLSSQLLSLEEELDIANILMAREQAKLEFAKEAPERTTKQKEKQGWFSWMWSGGEEEDEDEGEIVITYPDNKPGWLNKLNDEEKERLYKAIGYDSNQNVELKPGYISSRIDLHLEHCCVSLVNYSKEVLKVTVTDLTTTLEHRPENNGLRVSLKTESFVVEGVSIEHDLVPIITSDIGVYAPSVNQVFSLDFDINPVHVEADCAIKLNVQPVEIVYDEHAVTEVIAFFQVPQITKNDVMNVMYAGWNRVAEISRAGLQYAIEQHQTVHLSMNMRSPYVVIPEYGTLHRGGNVLVIDFGKLKVESELQPKNISLHECTMSEIESRLYDKFNITITEVKALLADSGEDWHTAQIQPDSEFHVLPSVGMQLAFFNTVKSDYKQLPQQKLEAKITTLKLNLTDEKIQWVADFFKHIPMPHSNSMMGLDDSVDGHIEPVLYAMVMGSYELMKTTALPYCYEFDEKSVQIEPNWEELKHIKRAVRTNSVIRHKPLAKQTSLVDRTSIVSTDSDHYYSASDHSDDDVDEWTKALEVPAVHDHKSTTNTISVLLRFVLGEVVIHVSKSADKIDTPYLMFRVNRLCVDAAMTVYGLAMQASLGGIQLVDKIHTGPSGEYLEILSNKSDADLISVVYRKVTPECPDFESAYRSVEQGLMVKFSSLKVVFDRAALLYLNSFLQGMFLSMNPRLDNELKKSSSTIISGPTDHNKEETQSLAQSLFIQGSQDVGKGPPGITKLHLVAKMDDLDIKMCNHENEFAEVQIKGLESKLLMKQSRLIIQAKMTDMSIEDMTENTLYPKVLTIEDDKVFNLKFVRYNKPSSAVTAPKSLTVDSSCRMRLGRVQCIVLYKFLSEFKSFIDPFFDPQSYDSYKVAAQTAMHDAIADVQEQGTRISLNLDIRAPILLLPQHSESTNVIVLKLGDLSLKNYFEDLEVKGTNFKQNWDHMYLQLEAMQVLRGKLSLNGNVELAHTIVEPINLKLDLKRALPPIHTDTAYEIGGKLHTIRMQVTQQDLKVMMATMRENGSENRLHVEKIDMEDLNPLMPDRLADGGPEYDITTPVVEIEQPLLLAPEVSDLARQTQFDFIMDGMVLTLFGEEEDPLAPVSPVRDELDALSRFEIGRIDLGGMLEADSSLELVIKLQSVSLDDIREHSNLAVKRLIMSNVQIPPSKLSMPLGEPMVTFEYKSSADGNQHINLNVDTIRVNVCVPYLLMVYNFFMYAMQPPEDNLHPSHSPPTHSHHTSDQHTPAEASKPMAGEAATVTTNTLTISGRFRQPEIVLFAEPTQKHSRVLVLKTNMAFDYFSHQDRERLEAKVRQLQIVSCVYGLANQARSMVLFPCDLEFTRSVTSAGSPVRMEAKISDVFLHLSATTLHIALDVMDTIKYDGQRGGDSMDMTYYPTVHHDLWTTKGISAERWLQTEPDGHDKKTFPLVKDRPASEELHVDMKKVQIMFEVENLDFHVPRLCVKTSLTANIEDWSRQLRIHSEVQLEVSYFNEKLALWEPLVEPVMISEGNHRPWEVIFKMVRAQSHPMSCSTGEFKLDKGDELDGDVHFMMSRVRQKSSSSETDTDSETDMTVIKPKPLLKKLRHGSDRSFDQEGKDEVDGPGGEEEESDVPLCTYLLVNSYDKLSINLTPQAMDVISEVTETIMRDSNSALKSVHDLPGFEMYNQLEVPANITLPSDLQANAENLHNIMLASKPVKVEPKEVAEGELVEIDEVDGLSFLSKGLAAVGNMMLSAGAFVFDEGEEENQNLPDTTSHHIALRLDGFDELKTLSHKKAVTRLVSLSPSKNETNYCVVYEVDVTHGRKVITVRSPLQMENHLTVPVEVYCLTEELRRYSGNNLGTHVGEYTQLKVLEPSHTYHVPLYVAYHCKLFVAPSHIGYEKTTSGLWWQELYNTKDRSRFFQCVPKERPNKNPFHFKFCFQVQCEDGSAMRQLSGLPKIIPHYTLHLHPPVILHNLLPYDVQFSLEGSSASSLTHGESTPLYTADLSNSPKLQFQISDYLGLDWTGSLELTSNLEEFKAISMESDGNVEGVNRQLSLSIHVNRSHSMDLHIYTPYWIINKTGLPLQIRGSRSEAVYENDISGDPLLFRFKKHRRKKAKLRVYNSKWTRSFSMDTVGSNGVVICHDKERNRKYQFMLQIQLSKLKLTKIVTVLPYFLVVNNTPHNLRYMEENEAADLWLNIASHECMPFWPATDSMRMYVKYQDSKVSSQHFCVDKHHITTLRMDKGTALCVEVSGGTETPITVTFMPYEHGDAPVKIINLCEDVFIKLHQKNQSQVSLLSPSQSVLYTWDDPTSERTLMWNVYNRKKPSYPAFISTDGCGEEPLSIQTLRHSSLLASSEKEARSKVREEKSRNGDPHVDSSGDDETDDEASVVIPQQRAPLLRMPSTSRMENKAMNTRTDKVVVYWVSFLDGLQRTLLFTQDERIAACAKKMNEKEQASLAMFVSLSGVGLSLMNALQQEVAYLSLSPTPALWEVEVKNRWKHLNMELVSWLEEKWRNDVRMVYLEDFMEADLVKMEMRKPFMGGLRRTYRPALWFQYHQSAHHTFIHSKIHRLQIDNQLSDAYFPTVLHPSPLPSYVVKKSGPKPFIELALMRRQVPENNIDSVKFFKMLFQEFSVQLDKGFLLSVYDIFASRQQQEQEPQSVQLAADMSVIHKTLRDLADIQSASRPQRIVFEYLHMSPLKMHISFSLDGHAHLATEPKNSSLIHDLVDFFLNSVGATLTEIKEVELRMAYFERRGALLTTSQLMSEVVNHYRSQAIQQAYVLILGLDVLGNPYGLVRDFTQGLGDFFYEPFLDSIQGPDKFTENLVRGVQSLLGHTCGGVASSISLITGSLGRALAQLSFDSDYKKRRQQLVSQHPRHLPESLLMASKGFVMGVGLGISGVVVSPVRGAVEEGCEGFFKGIGKGLLGLITKPTGGAVDMVSMAFDGIHRAAEMGDDVVFRMRLPRYINPDRGLKPYSPYQAIGQRLLNCIGKGRYAESDTYWAHAALNKNDKTTIAVVTTKRILMVEKCRFWSDWDIEWEVLLSDIVAPPAVSGEKLRFRVRTDESRLNLFSSDEREISSNDPETLQWLQRKIEQAISARRQ